jgi:Flp pilus assembly protein TadG
MIVRRRKVRAQNRAGTAIVEFAVLLPFIMLVFLIGTDWCRIFYVATTITDCARRGALAASGLDFGDRNLTDAERITRGKNAAILNGETLSPSLTKSQIAVAVTSEHVTVTIDYEFQSTTGLLGFDRGWSLSRSVQMSIHP